MATARGWVAPSVLPGFGLTLGFAGMFLTAIVLVTTLGGSISLKNRAPSGDIEGLDVTVRLPVVADPA